MHPRFGNNLIWLSQISDEFLKEVYSSSSVLLALSLAEGFGLPLVEASYFGLPLIVRDIPVFREICGNRATYFDGETSDDLYILLNNWIEEKKDGEPFLTNLPSLISWKESATYLLSALGKMQGINLIRDEQ